MLIDYKKYLNEAKSPKSLHTMSTATYEDLKQLESQFGESISVKPVADT